MESKDIEFASVAQKDSDASVESGKRSPHVYTPTIPENSPVVLSFSNLTVSKIGGNKKKLLNNISGSITGGMWAIMGK